MQNQKQAKLNSLILQCNTCNIFIYFYNSWLQSIKSVTCAYRSPLCLVNQPQYIAVICFHLKRSGVHLLTAQIVNNNSSYQYALTPMCSHTHPFSMPDCNELTTSSNLPLISLYNCLKLTDTFSSPIFRIM